MIESTTRDAIEGFEGAGRSFAVACSTEWIAATLRASVTRALCYYDFDPSPANVRNALQEIQHGHDDLRAFDLKYTVEYDARGYGKPGIEGPNGMPLDEYIRFKVMRINQVYPQFFAPDGPSTLGLFGFGEK